MISHLEITAFLGLGGNLGDPLAAFRRARQELTTHSAINSCHSSPLYQTPPVGGPEGQPNYLNAVLMLETSLTAQELLAVCQKIELTEGRQRNEHWGARTLDIDLLLFGEQQLNEKNLEIPHPRLMERQFVLLPLADLAPALKHPVSGLNIQRQLDKLPHVKEIQQLKLDW